MKRAAVVAATVLSAVPFATAVASAAPFASAGSSTATPSALVVCLGFETTDYTPPLTLESRPTAIDATATYSLCLGAALSATGRVTGTSPTASCVAVSAPMVTERVTFASGQVDVIRYTTSVAARVGGFTVVTLTGTVERGPHAGASAVKTVQLTPVPEPTACLGDGLDRAVGLTQLEIIG